MKDIIVEKASVKGSASTESSSNRSALYESRGPSTRTVSADDLRSLRKCVSEAVRDSPLLTVVSAEMDVVDVPSLFGPVPFGSTLSHQLRPEPDAPLVIPPTMNKVRSAPPTSVTRSSVNIRPRADTRYGVPFVDLPCAMEQDCAFMEFANPILLSQAIAIERRTRQQGDSTLWHELRKVTLTASRMHRVLTRKTVDEQFAATIFDDRDISHLPAIAHGREKEALARKDYLAAQAELGNEGCLVQACGLVLHPQFKYLGASPDGQVFDPSVSCSNGLLEIKCPLNVYNDDLTPEEACHDIPAFCCEMVDGQVALKRNHAYYTQVQAQLAITGLTWCDFVVWAGPRRMSCERISFDQDFWVDCLPTLLQFCDKFLKK